LTMPGVDLEKVVLALILIDVFIVVVFFVLIWKLKHFNVEDTLKQKIEILESLLGEADQLSKHLLNTLEDKHQILSQMDEKFEQRIKHLARLTAQVENTAGSLETLAQDRQIHQLCQKGMDPEMIAQKLSIPREKVSLVLNMQKNSA
jgi:F0F1-type ATP synthase membrane subunit b/b'